MHRLRRRVARPPDAVLLRRQAGDPTAGTALSPQRLKDPRLAVCSSAGGMTTKMGRSNPGVRSAAVCMPHIP